MSDLLEFLAARLDEDEREIRRDPPVGMGYAVLPARMMREVAAKRRRLQRHRPADDPLHGCLCAWCSSPAVSLYQEWPCPDIRGDAAVYSDHPDYDQAWTPQS